MLRGGNSSLALYTNYKMFFIRQKDEQMCNCKDRVGMGTIVGEQFKLHTTTNTRQFGHKLDSYCLKKLATLIYPLVVIKMLTI